MFILLATALLLNQSPAAPWPRELSARPAPDEALRVNGPRAPGGVFVYPSEAKIHVTVAGPGTLTVRAFALTLKRGVATEGGISVRVAGQRQRYLRLASDPNRAWKLPAHPLLGLAPGRSLTLPIPTGSHRVTILVGKKLRLGVGLRLGYHAGIGPIGEESEEEPALAGPTANDRVEPTVQTTPAVVPPVTAPSTVSFASPSDPSSAPPSAPPSALSPDPTSAPPFAPALPPPGAQAPGPDNSTEPTLEEGVTQPPPDSPGVNSPQLATKATAPSGTATLPSTAASPVGHELPAAAAHLETSDARLSAAAGAGMCLPVSIGRAGPAAWIEGSVALRATPSNLSMALHAGVCHSERTLSFTAAHAAGGTASVSTRMLTAPITVELHWSEFIGSTSGVRLMAGIGGGLLVGAISTSAYGVDRATQRQARATLAAQLGAEVGAGPGALLMRIQGLISQPFEDVDIRNVSASGLQLSLGYRLGAD